MRSNAGLHVDTAVHFSTFSVFILSVNKCNQNLNLPGVGRYDCTFL